MLIQPRPGKAFGVMLTTVGALVLWGGLSAAGRTGADPAEGSMSRNGVEIDSAAVAAAGVLPGWRLQLGAPPAGRAEIALSSAGDLEFGVLAAGGVGWPMTPAVGRDGSVFFGSADGYLYSMGPSGSIRWKYQAGGGVTSSPAVGVDGGVYFGCRDGRVYALNQDGTLRWSYPTGAEIMSSPALGPDGTVYIGSNDHYLYALRPDGSLRWRFGTGDAVISSPAVGKFGTIYFGSVDSYVYALKPDGGLAWSFKTGAGVLSSPALGYGGMIYVGSNDRNLYALTREGVLSWHYNTGGYVVSSPAVGLDGSLFVSSYNGSLLALGPDGTLKWQYDAGENIWSSPSLGADGTLYIGISKAGENFLVAFSPVGTIRWAFRATDKIYSSPAIGASGTIYFGSRDRYFYAVESGSDQGLACSPWPKFRQGGGNCGIVAAVTLFPPDHLAMQYIPALGTVEPLDQLSVSLAGDGHGNLTQAPVFLTPALGQLSLAMPDTADITRNRSLSLLCSRLGWQDVSECLRGNKYAGTRQMQILESGQAGPESVELRGGGDSLQIVYLQGPPEASGVKYSVSFSFSGLNYANVPSISYDNIPEPFHSRITTGGYSGGEVGSVTSRICGPDMYTGSAPSNVAFMRNGRFSLRWKATGDGNLTLEVNDLTRGITIPPVSYPDEPGWGFMTDEDFGGPIGAPGLNGQFYYEAFRVRLPEAQRSVGMKDRLAADRTAEFGFWLNGLVWVVTGPDSQITMPAPETVWTIDNAFGFWNADSTVFTQYPDMPWPGDAWNIEVSGLPSETEPENPAAGAILSYTSQSYSSSDSMALQVLLENPDAAISGGQFLIGCQPSGAARLSRIATTDRTAGWITGGSSTWNESTVLFYAPSGGLIATGEGAILTLYYELDRSVPGSSDAVFILSGARLVDENHRTVTTNLKNTLDVHGEVRYTASQAPVEGISLSVESGVGGYSVETVSDAQGEWELQGISVYLGDSYLTPFRACEKEDCITATDAAYIMAYVQDNRFFVNPLQAELADVSGDGQVTEQDAEQVLSYCVGLPEHGRSGAWTFNPERIKIREIGGQVEDELRGMVFSACLSGDVTGSYGGDACYQAPFLAGFSGGPAAAVTLRALNEAGCDTVDIGLFLSAAAGRLIALDLELECPGVGMSFAGIVKTDGHGRVVAAASPGEDRLRISAVSADWSGPDDPFLRLRFLGRGGDCDLSHSLRVLSCRLNDQPVDFSSEVVFAGNRGGGAALPKAYALAQNYPNPFNPSTTINYGIPGEAGTVEVSLRVYDLRGRKVTSLVEGKVEPGNYSVQWNGRDEAGRAVSSGVYLYRIQAGRFIQTKKMVLLK